MGRIKFPDAINLKFHSAALIAGLISVENIHGIGHSIRVRIIHTLRGPFLV